MDLNRVATALEGISEWSGRAVAWLVPAMVLLIGYDVAMRYLANSGSVALQELEWHLFAVLFLLGGAYTLKHDEHVRVDVLHHGRLGTPRVRAWVDLFGTLLFLMPFCILIITGAWPFIQTSFQFGEGSPDPGGLPMRYLLKAMIPLGFALILLQGTAVVIRSIQFLRRGQGR